MRVAVSKMKARFQKLWESKQAHPFHEKKVYKCDCLFISNKTFFCIKLIGSIIVLFGEGGGGRCCTIAFIILGSHGIAKFENPCPRRCSGAFNLAGRSKPSRSLQ